MGLWANIIHLVLIIFSIGIPIDIFMVVYSSLVFYICMLQNFKKYQFLLVFTFSYIYDLIVLTISLHLKEQILFMLSLIYSLMSIISQIVFLYKLMHHLYWYFIKGEKIHVLSFNWYLSIDFIFN